jgi:hypothetical protein
VDRLRRVSLGNLLMEVRNTCAFDVKVLGWDRERADDTLTDEDWPHRAELRELVIKSQSGRPTVAMAIDYLAPRHVFRSPITLKRLKKKLTEVLKEKPKPVLDALTDWPFDLEVTCSMNGDRIAEPMRFGSSR